MQFTDRYGGKSPSWLRGCHSQCEATGWVPVYNPIGDDDADIERVLEYDDIDPRFLMAWEAAEKIKPSNDGWHFVECPDCHGTGRVPWYVSIERIPSWFTNGLKVFRELLRHRSPGTNSWAHAWLCAKCAWLYDLLRLRN